MSSTGMADAAEDDPGVVFFRPCLGILGGDAIEAWHVKSWALNSWPMSFVPSVIRPDTLTDRPLWFVARGAAVLVRAEGEAVSLPGCGDIVDLGVDPGAGRYLGRIDGQDAFAVLDEQLQVNAPWCFEGLRGLYGRLEDERFAVAGRAVQITHFYATHRFCGRCGTATMSVPSERSVRCPSCELASYPRVSPAIIVLVRRGDEALLARSSRFASSMYSTLAGFVEPGETLEETLEREVFEEVGVRVGGARYFGSQPWPYPHSLMVGFTAEYVSGEIAVDGEEILGAAWFKCEALPLIPPKLSIARQLIDDWILSVERSKQSVGAGR